MRRNTVRACFAGGVATLAGAATAIVMVAGPASAGAAAPASSKPVVLVNCNGGGLVKPGTYDVGCMPSQELVIRSDLDQLEVDRLWERDAEGQQLRSELRVRALREVPDSGRFVASRSVAASRGAAVLQPAHLDLHRQASVERALPCSDADPALCRSAVVRVRSDGLDADGFGGGPDRDWSGPPRRAGRQVGATWR